MRFKTTSCAVRRAPSGMREEAPLKGSARFLLLMSVAFIFLVGGFYIFAVNERAVYGYDVRELEKELTVLKKQNAALRLREAEGRSLASVEAGSATLRMEKAVPAAQLIIEKPGPVAYR